MSHFLDSTSSLCSGKSAQKYTLMSVIKVLEDPPLKCTLKLCAISNV